VPSRTVAPRTLRTLQDLTGEWTLTFPKAQPRAAGGSLQSWTESSDPAVKYFSGTATYTRTFTLPKSSTTNGLVLDLGDVREIAEVSINGTKLNTILWAAPYRIETGRLLHAGENTIKVEVTNFWPNRLIGDEQPGVTARQTFTGIHAYSANSPLFPAGMLGPVTLLESR
jgi:hypothetical protein